MRNNEILMQQLNSQDSNWPGKVLGTINHEVTSRAYQLEEILKAMSEKDQVVLVPYFLYGFSEKAIGEALGIGLDAAHKRIQYAIKRVRKKLGVKA